MDTVTQENAALVEEAASASKSIESQAHSLSRQIAYFKTGDEEAERMLATAAAVADPVVVEKDTVMPLALAS